MKKLFILLIIFCSLLYSHPGRLDSNGGHRDSRTGTYHYHRKPSSSSSSKSKRNYFLYERVGEYKSDRDYITIRITDNGEAFWKEGTNENKFIIGNRTNQSKQFTIKSVYIQNRGNKDILLIFLDIDTFTIELEKDNIYKFTKIKSGE